MKIDAHQHFWKYRAPDYPWITSELKALRRDFLPPALGEVLRTQGFDGSVVVQARQSLEETRWLLSLAADHPFIRGVVGWVDLRSEGVDEQLAEFERQPRFVGVRHVVHDEPDDEFMLRPAFLRGIERLGEHGLRYDLLLYPKHLPAAIKIADRFPAQPLVLDHLAKPLIRSGTLVPWREHIRELAQRPNVWCKVSGMVTEARWAAWTQEEFKPYLDVVFEAFGTDRLMFGSDWPVCLVSGTYASVVGIVRTYLGSAGKEMADKVFGANATRFYGLPCLEEELPPAAAR